MLPGDKVIRFDWAMKRLLRQKSNFVVVEGFLSVLLDEDIRIHRFLESESNQTDREDKFNRVDMLAEDSSGRLIIIEMQNEQEYDYFHRMLYGTSKSVTEYISIGEGYGSVKKVYSINIVYFELGQGSDYVYHGRTEFRGLHNPDDILQLTERQRKMFSGVEAGDIFPEYYVLRVNDFNKVAVTPLDEWIAFLKTGFIPWDAKARGLEEARERLRIDSLPPDQRIAYENEMLYRMRRRGEMESSRIDGVDEGMKIGLREGIEKGMKKGLREGRKKGLEEGIKKGIKEGIKEGIIEGRNEGLKEGLKEGEDKGRREERIRIAQGMRQAGIPDATISELTGLSLADLTDKTQSGS